MSAREERKTVGDYVIWSHRLFPFGVGHIEAMNLMKVGRSDGEVSYAHSEDGKKYW